MLLRCHRGYILFDLLLTLSCIILFTSFLFPSINSLLNLQHDHNQYFLADEMYNKILKENIITKDFDSVDNSIFYKDKNFKIDLTHYNEHVLLICINWENHKKLKESICRYVPT